MKCNLIKKIRLEKNHETLKSVSEKIGLSESTISLVENNRIKNPSDDTISKLEKYYNIKRDDFLNSENIMIKKYKNNETLKAKYEMKQSDLFNKVNKIFNKYFLKNKIICQKNVDKLFLKC